MLPELTISPKCLGHKAASKYHARHDATLVATATRHFPHTLIKAGKGRRGFGEIEETTQDLFGEHLGPKIIIVAEPMGIVQTRMPLRNDLLSLGSIRG